MFVPRCLLQFPSDAEALLLELRGLQTHSISVLKNCIPTVFHGPRTVSVFVELKPDNQTSFHYNPKWKSQQSLISGHIYQVPDFRCVFTGFDVHLLLLAVFSNSFYANFKIGSHCHAQKVHRPKYHFLFCTFFHGSPMNIIRIKTKNAQSMFRKKLSMRIDCT